MKSIIKFIVIMLSLLLFAGISLADTPLPASNWYAVTWVEATDTLHWINANGEQASIARPKLEGEISQAQTRLHISPDGRYLVVISPLNTGREGIGFYDLESGQFVQTHESQPNEVFLFARQQPFSEFSGQVAFALRDNSTNAWRMLVFDSATGNALHQMAWDDELLPQNLLQNDIWSPSIAQVNVDEAFNVLEVRFQMLPNDNSITASYPSYIWRIPANNPASISPDTLTYNPFAGFNINPMTGEIVFASFDLQFGNPTTNDAANSINILSGDSQNTLVTEGGGSARLARWLRNGEWVGYYGTNGAFAPHWTVLTAEGQNGLPLSPAIIDVYHTADGFLTKNTGLWRLNHVTDLNHEGFADPMGNTIFQPNTAFAVIYTTPANTPFQLTSVAETNNGQVGNVAGTDFTTGNACPPAPPARLSAGMSARVTFTDGRNLRVRTAPAGDYIMEIPEGTPATVLEGPVCADGYQWYNLDLGNGTGGWAAEGDSDDYYLEPFNVQVNPSLQIAPTSTPQRVVIAQATATPMRVTSAGNCPSSLPTQLSVGIIGRTVQPDGTLAMRTNLNDTTPTYQIPTGQLVEIVNGPQCMTNLRMWQVRTVLNGQTVTGWVAESFGQTYYVIPN